MYDGHDEGDMASVLDAFQEQMRAIAEAQQKRVRLTGSATSRDKSMTVTVNANGVVIDTQFHSGIAQLSHDEIAKTFTRTAQAAAENVKQKNQELSAPLADKRARLPKLSELIEGMPDFPSQIPLEPPVPLTPPEYDPAYDEATMKFTEVEEIDHDTRSARARGVTDSSW